MKKLLILLLALICAVALTGCVAHVSSTTDKGETTTGAPSPVIVATPSPTPSPTPVPTVTDKEISEDFSFGYRTGTYSGDFVNGQPNGNGRFDTTNDAGEKWYYEGAWVDGHFSGEGKTVWATGQLENGTYTNDQLTNGTKKLEDGSQETGSFKDGLLNGQGELIDCLGLSVFKGEFVKGLPNRTSEDIDNLQTSLKGKCIAFDYKKIARQPDVFKGQFVYITGSINTLTDNGDGSIDCIIGVNNSWSKQIYVQFLRSNGEPLLLEYDKVKIWGICEGVYSGLSEPNPLVRALVMRLK